MMMMMITILLTWGMLPYRILTRISAPNNFLLTKCYQSCHEVGCYLFTFATHRIQFRLGLRFRPKIEALPQIFGCEKREGNGPEAKGKRGIRGRGRGSRDFRVAVPFNLGGGAGAPD